MAWLLERSIFFLPSISDYIDFCSFNWFRLKSIEEFTKINIISVYTRVDAVSEYRDGSHSYHIFRLWHNIFKVNTIILPVGRLEPHS